MSTSLGALMLRLQCDVIAATSSLFYALYGVNLIHRQNGVQMPNVFPTPEYPPLRVFPYVSENAPFSRRVGPGGPVEQFVLKAWFVGVYSIWEDDYRNRLLNHFQQLTPHAIRPEADVLGDLGYIRGDLVHHRAVANKCAAKCTVLKWFSHGEKMHLEIRHVLDFLNQMGWITERPIHVHDDRVLMWLPFRDQWTPSQPVPRLASVRPIIDDELPYRYGMSIVFEDGIFARVQVQPADSLNDEQWMGTAIDENGDIRVPNGALLSATELYAQCFGPTTEGPGTYSPPFRFTRR